MVQSIVPIQLRHSWCATSTPAGDGAHWAGDEGTSEKTPSKNREPGAPPRTAFLIQGGADFRWYDEPVFEAAAQAPTGAAAGVAMGVWGISHHPGVVMSIPSTFPKDCHFL